MRLLVGRLSVHLYGNGSEIMLKKELEISCYVAGAGAFGVFLRWIQDQLAFNEAGLPDRNALHVIFPVYVLICAIVFRHFVLAYKKAGVQPPEDFAAAFENSGRLFTLLRWVCGGVMFVGGTVLLMTSETDKFAGLLRALSLTAMLAGLCFPLMMTWADKAASRLNVLCLLSFVPMFVYAVWLVYCYRANSIEPVVWSYAVEVFTVIVTMVAFFRVAGFAFQTPKPLRCLFDVMFAAMMCLTSLADERYMGMQLILLGSALTLMFEAWLLVKNLAPIAGETAEEAAAKDETDKDDEDDKPVVSSDGFEHL